MAGVVLVPPKFQFLDAVGNPLANGKVDVYLAGSTTRTSTWQDQGQTTLNTNPIILDANGSCTMVVDDSLTYKLVVKNSANVEQTHAGGDNIVGGTTRLAQMSFTQAGSGAVARSAQDKMREKVTPFDFAAVGDGVADDTQAVQSAIDTGKTVDLIGRNFAVNNLTQITNSQAIVSSQGVARLIKNANGPILTSTGDDFLMENVTWRGDASTPTFTGDGVLSTGQRPQFINCGGRWVTGRALKATGGRVRVKGTCDGYFTADATATGYDIEIGQSGTATLYHELDEVYSSQSTGGILLIDTGSHTIKGGQFGKLTIQAGTRPSGVNGGKTIGARILGDVTVELSTADFACNQFGPVAITFDAATSGCHMDISNSFQSGATITNNGNANNRIEREVSSGGSMQKKYGDDSSVAVVSINGASGDFTYPGNLVLANAKVYKINDAGGTGRVAASLNASDNFQFGENLNAGNAIVQAGTGGVFLAVGGTSIVQAYAGGVRPQVDGTLDSGTAARRWANVFGTNIRPGAGTATWTSGAGTPEGAVTAAVGSLYTRTDGGAGTTLYVKESGAGNTGWVAK